MSEAEIIEVSSRTLFLSLNFFIISILLSWKMNLKQLKINSFQLKIKLQIFGPKEECSY